MGRIVIVCYRPLPGKADELRRLVHAHHDRLQAEGLVTQRAPVVMEAANGSIIEVFEWESREAIERAHHNSAVSAMWQEFAAACEYVPVADVPEASELFSEFVPLVS
ncbi:MAG: hypothetical protein B7733_04230 [Myxococcales bacterium FL481]|nr:MAG: hypothetical protein B7733_04230 [Myxococcales bacterium FL481]